jgi:DNA-binding NarL/FixJ family response regulator
VAPSIPTIKLVVADDHRLMLDAIRTTLEYEEGIEIVGEAQSGDEVLRVVQLTRPDVVLLDLRMPGMNGFSVLDALRERYPKIKVVILSAVDEPWVIDAALRRGAQAYVLKQVEPRGLGSAIRQATESTVFRLAAAHSVAAASPEADLSPREVTILRGVAAGGSNKQIARAVSVSEAAVKFHLTNIYRKLGVANRTEAARYAHAHRLVGDHNDDPKIS